MGPVSDPPLVSWTVGFRDCRVLCNDTKVYLESSIIRLRQLAATNLGTVVKCVWSEITSSLRCDWLLVTTLSNDDTCNSNKECGFACMHMLVRTWGTLVKPAAQRCHSSSCHVSKPIILIQDVNK